MGEKRRKMSKIINQYRVVQRVARSSTQLQLQKYTMPCSSSSSSVLLPQREQQQTLQWRGYQKPAPKQGIVSKFVENLREGMSRNKQLQDNLKKFKEEKSKMDETDSLKDVKDRLSRMNQVKEAASPYIEKIEESVKESSKTVGKLVKDATDSEIFKKGHEVKDEIAKSVKDAASKLSEQGEEIGKTPVGKAFSTVKEDLFDDLAKESRPYQRPDELRRRTNDNSPIKSQKAYEANEDVDDVVLHKDSKWQQQWKDFRDNNPVVTGLFSLKTKYDESDNIAVRASRVLTDKLSDMFSDVFSQSEQAATLAEISKIDPHFNKTQFIKECEFEIIPTVLEAYIRGDVDILQDWCHEGAFNVLSTQIKQYQSMGLINESRILDIREVDLALAKIMEQGPVLILTFQAQQIVVVKDKWGKVVEGKVDSIENVNYVWAMCRDQSIFDHRSAWRVLEFGIQQVTPYI